MWALRYPAKLYDAASSFFAITFECHSSVFGCKKLVERMFASFSSQTMLKNRSRIIRCKSISGNRNGKKIIRTTSARKIAECPAIGTAFSLGKVVEHAHVPK